MRLLQFPAIIVLLVIAVAIAIVSNRLRVPYSISLVVFGVVLSLAASLFPILGRVSGQGGLFSEDVFFGILLPPLIYEAALHINFRSLRSRLRLILFFTFIGVIVSTILTGLIVSALTGISIVFALLLGAILSPTDPIGVIELFKRTRVPEQLSITVEAESLLNDGVGIVVFVAVSQEIQLGNFQLIASIQEFAFLAGGGLGLGLLFGGLAYVLHRRVDDPNIETVLSVVMAYGSYNAATTLGVSGIICTAVVGIATGTWVMPKAISEASRTTLLSFWNVAVYIVNSLIFLSMGLLVDLIRVFQIIPLIAVVLIFLTLARVAFVYGSLPLSRLLSRESIGTPISWYNVLVLSGVRGAIPIVLALSLFQSSLPIPPDTKELIVSIVIGTAVLSITLQNVVASWYVKRTFKENQSG
jgi:CPA1 family monovalent cation:H+ antiporter